MNISQNPLDCQAGEFKIDYDSLGILDISGICFDSVIEEIYLSDPGIIYAENNCWKCPFPQVTTLITL